MAIKLKKSSVIFGRILLLKGSRIAVKSDTLEKHTMATETLEALMAP